MVTPCFDHYTMVAITQNVHRYFDLTLSHVNNPLCMLTLLNVSGMSAYVNCVKGNRYLRDTGYMPEIAVRVNVAIHRRC